MRLDFDACYRAVAARDPRFDGRFFTGVTTTGIYCRPVCPARTPARRNVRFFAHPAAAEAAGFRPCRRCRPEASPDSPDWDVRADLVGRALRLIAAGLADDEGVRGLARRLAVTERHLHRLFVAEIGVGPQAVARTRRLQLARRLLAETDLPISDVAFAAGFGSIRQFNAAIRQSCGLPPRELRARASRPGAGREDAATADPPPQVTLRLGYRPPYDAAAIFGFLAARAVPGVEEADRGRYARTIPEGSVELVAVPDAPQVLLRVRAADVRGLAHIVARCRRLLDLDADPAAIIAALGADPALAALVAAHPGLRLPGAYDGFELAVRAVLGQRVSVAAARTLAGRLAARVGEPVADGTAVDGTLARRFPTPERLATADLTGLGLPAARQRTLRELAEAVAAGELDLDGGADVGETLARLTAIDGVGRWTAAYVALRALRDVDAFPASDLGIRRALDRLGVPLEATRAWRPWRGYAALYLWTMATEEPRDRPPNLADPDRPAQPARSRRDAGRGRLHRQPGGAGGPAAPIAAGRAAAYGR